jgi:hypothetical protein
MGSPRDERFGRETVTQSGKPHARQHRHGAMTKREGWRRADIFTRRRTGTNCRGIGMTMIA